MREKFFEKLKRRREEKKSAKETEEKFREKTKEPTERKILKNEGGLEKEEKISEKEAREKIISLENRIYVADMYKDKNKEKERELLCEIEREIKELLEKARDLPLHIRYDILLLESMAKQSKLVDTGGTLEEWKDMVQTDRERCDELSAIAKSGQWKGDMGRLVFLSTVFDKGKKYDEAMVKKLTTKENELGEKNQEEKIEKAKEELENAYEENEKPEEVEEIK